MATALAIREFIAALPPAHLEPRVFIYGLTDPRTDLVRYIGKSVRPAERFRNHMNERANCHRCHWLGELRGLGLEPGFVMLEAIEGEWAWQESERFWIAFARREGWPLTNNTDGGDGVPGLPPETRARMAATWKGRKHRPESLAKMGAAMRGKTHTIATKAKMSATHTGRKITWVDKVAASLRKLSDSDQQRIIARLGEGARVHELATEYGVHRTTISKVKKGEYLCQK